MTHISEQTVFRGACSDGRLSSLDASTPELYDVVRSKRRLLYFRNAIEVVMYNTNYLCRIDLP